MNDGGTWSARLARFQLAGAATWWMVLFFSTKVVLFTILDGMHSRNHYHYHYHKRNGCVRSSRATAASLEHFHITPILCYASFSNPCECPSMPCFQHQSVCLSTLLLQLFKCPNALFLYHQRTIKQSMHDASFVLLRYACPMLECNTLPCYPIPS